MDTISLLYYRESTDVKNPEYAYGANDGDACMDVYVHHIERHFDRVIVHSGLHFSVPKGYEMQVRPRSNLTKYRWALLNTPGTVDSNYRGEVTAVFTCLENTGDIGFPYRPGERAFQINLHKIPQIELVEVDEISNLGKTNRGEGGYGSSGK